MSGVLPVKWQEFLAGTPAADLWQKPLALAQEKRKSSEVFPPAAQVFRAFAAVPPEKVQVVLLGQDPYHGAGQAEGLAFSVPPGVKLPPSLRNIFREYVSDLQLPEPANGHLGAWAQKGVLLLNAVLTVDSGAPGSHARLGWQEFTDGVLQAISDKTDGKVFILWGSYAMKKAPLIDSDRHCVISGVHPSPLSAHRGFFGSRPFSRSESYLHTSIWQLPAAECQTPELW